MREKRGHQDLPRPSGQTTPNSDPYGGVGKRTLVEGIRLAPFAQGPSSPEEDHAGAHAPDVAENDQRAVQRKAVDGIDEAARDVARIADIAGHGVSGVGSALPHLEQIQASFG